MDPDSLLETVPFDIKEEIVRELDKDARWKKVAMIVMKYYEEAILSNREMEDMETKSSPTNYLLQRLVRSGFTVRLLQEVLCKSELFHVMNKLITNEEVRFFYPAQDHHDEVKLASPYDKLKVVVYGSPYPDLQWHHNGTALVGQTHDKLPVECFKREDSGEYFCKAVQNIDGRQKVFCSPRFYLQVAKSSPSIITGRDLQNMKLNTGEDLVLNLGVMAEPEPVYIWHKNGREVSRGALPVFKIMSVGMNNEGTYFCQVVNEEGSCCSREITVEITPPCFAPDEPKIIIKPHVSADSYAFGDTVSLTFKVHCRHKIDFSCTVNDKCISDLEVHRPTFTTKTLNDYYHVFNLYYEVNKDDWMRGNRGPIMIKLEAKSCGQKEQTVEEIVKVNVKLNFDHKRYSARNKYALIIANEDYPQGTLVCPVRDSQALARQLEELDFRCMMCRNVTQAEFICILNLFTSFVQDGDYVVFYYAGHGYHSKGVDFMIPLLDKFRRTFGSDSIPVGKECISTNEVFNRLQKKNPALLFLVYDTCREQTICGDTFQDCHVEPKMPNSNSITLYATSESYVALEVRDGSSVLMEEFLKFARKSIPVQELGRMVLQGIEHSGIEDDEQGSQKPRLDIDIGELRSLTDPWAPYQEDHETVLKKWEKLSNVGGKHCQMVQIDGDTLNVNVQCEQEGYPKFISNWVNVIINISLDRKQDDMKSLSERELKVCIDLNASKENIVVAVTGDPIKCIAKDLQALHEELSLILYFMKGEEDICQCEFNLGKPSLCDIISSQSNDLNCL